MNLRAHRRRTRVAAAAVALLIGTLSLRSFGVASAERSGPPPTPVPPRGSPSPFPQALSTPADAVEAPHLDVAAAMLADLDAGQVMLSTSPELPRPIASLTKVLTALIVLERRALDDVVTVAPEAVFDDDDFGATSTLGLRAGERRTVRQLLDALMLQSANDAAVALAIEVSGSERSFVRTMNRRAAALGLRDTEVYSPHGLDDRGRSTVRDLLDLTREAYGTPGFARIAASKFRSIPAPRGAPRRVQNRNALLWLYPGATGVKTGSTAGAGYCLIATAARDGRRLVAIVLGDRDEPFSEAAALLDHGFEGFEERTFVAAGDPIGTVAIRGGAVAVHAGREVTALVGTATAGTVSERVSVAADAVFPPEPDERIGTISFVQAGPRRPMLIGSSPLLVSEVPPPPDTGEEPWWARAAGAVARGVVDAVGGLAG